MARVRGKILCAFCAADWSRIEEMYTKRFPNPAQFLIKRFSWWLRDQKVKGKGEGGVR